MEGCFRVQGARRCGVKEPMSFIFQVLFGGIEKPFSFGVTDGSECCLYIGGHVEYLFEGYLHFALCFATISDTCLNCVN